ncbi:MAG: cytochrome c [bacterium]
MNKRWGWLLVAAAVGGGAYYALGPFSSLPSSDPRDGALVVRGERVYAQNCAACHGAAAVGEDPKLPQGGRKATGGYLAPALNGTGHAWHHPPDALFEIIAEGSRAADSQMAGWGGRISDRDIGAVIAFIRSLWPGKVQAHYREQFEP